MRIYCPCSICNEFVRYNSAMREFAFLMLGMILASLFFLGFKTEPERAPTQTAAAETSSQADTQEPTVEPLGSTAPETYRVTKVVDGDTLAIDMNGESVTLRLIGLDTPETVDPRKPVQCFGKEASDKAKELLTGTSISIETDPTQDTYDKYGRLLAYVYLPNGTLFNKYMIQEGYGHEYTYDKAYKYQAAFKAAQQAAQSAEKGLWAPDACTESESAVPSTASAFTPTGAYDCSSNAYNCSSFKTQAEAQYVFELCGDTALDIHRLDSDKDGVVCESLP